MKASDFNIPTFPSLDASEVEEFLEICETGLQNSEVLSQKALDFLQETQDRLESYGLSTSFSPAQIRFLRSIESQLEAKGIF